MPTDKPAASVLKKTLRAEDGDVTHYCVARTDRNGIIVARTVTEDEAIRLAQGIDACRTQEEARALINAWHDGRLVWRVPTKRYVERSPADLHRVADELAFERAQRRAR